MVDGIEEALMEGGGAMPSKWQRNADFHKWVTISIRRCGRPVYGQALGGFGPRALLDVCRVLTTWSSAERKEERCISYDIL